MVQRNLHETPIIEVAETIIRLSGDVLQKAPLTDEQRADMQEVQQAATRFRELALAESDLIRERDDAAALQRVRHDLRNHVNIIVGYTRIIVRDLPDNLLLHLAIVRDIHETAARLLACVDAIRQDS